jgi:hypothetical protein
MSMPAMSNTIAFVRVNIGIRTWSSPDKKGRNLGGLELILLQKIG